jgi:glycosyltransferase involved in cell wall biosynthesis
MVIGIDVRMWAESGIGRYVRNLVRELARIDSADRYVLFCLAKDHEEIFRAVGTSDRWRFVIADYLWYTFSEQLFLPFLLYRENLDLVHFPHFNIPILYFKPFAVTIHDLTHFTFAMKRASTRSGFVYGIKHAAYSFVFSQAVRRSRKIFAVSEYVKNALCERFTLSREKIVVTYESAETPVPISTTEAREFLAKKNIGSTYFFYVGNAHPHKNIEFLLEAFKEFRQTHQDVQLVLAGKENYFWKQLLESSRSRHLLSNVLYLGYVSDTELAILYSRAVSYVFPSL